MKNLNEREEENLSGLCHKDFQTSIDGKATDLFILSNEKGMEVALTNYGGALLTIMAPDKHGNLANVVQGHDSIEKVIHSPEPFLSTLIGRYGNRIANGEFLLDGKTYTLTINNGPNSLHGGPTGFHARVWDVLQVSGNSITLHYLSADMEEGFPGNLDVTVVYTLTNENELKINYTATTDKATVVNLTHHAFFSLSGLATPTATVDNQILEINADCFTPMNEVSITTGEILKVAGTPMDFRTPHTIGSRIDDDFEQLRFGKGYDHCYVLNKRVAGELSFAARCVEPVSGRTLEVYTTEPGVQIYTSNWHSGFEGYHGATFPARSAVCFEAQHFPDTPNKGHFPSAVLRPGEVYTQETIYKFGVAE